MIVVSLMTITTIMVSLTDITMMVTIVGMITDRIVVLPTVPITFLVSLTAITKEWVGIQGGRMVVFRDITIL